MICCDNNKAFQGIEIPAKGDSMRRISINGGNLIINQVGPDNIGLYTCTVRSVNGEEESSSGWLKIIGELFPE